MNRCADDQGKRPKHPEFARRSRGRAGEHGVVQWGIGPATGMSPEGWVSEFIHKNIDRGLK
jgi:hypothetical protein